MTMTVGPAAQAAGVSAKAVRLWEAKGLLPPAERTEAGYRLFAEEDLGVLRFIRQAKALGLPLGEIKEILDLQREGSVPCARVTELLDAHLEEIDRALADLGQLRDALASTRSAAAENRSRGEQAVVCRLIENDPGEAGAASGADAVPGDAG